MWYKTLSPPLRVIFVPLHRLIDIGKTRFYLKSCSKKWMRGHSICRARSHHHYRNNEPKINVILTVESGTENIAPNLDGSIKRPRRWIYISQENVDQLFFGGFINETLHYIESHHVPGNYDDTRICIWHNVRAYQIAYIAMMIEDRASENLFGPICRPLYCPEFAPIEQCFCELAVGLSRLCRREWPFFDLRNNIISSDISQNGGMYSTFIHCGYPFS